VADLYGFRLSNGLPPRELLDRDLGQLSQVVSLKSLSTPSSEIGAVSALPQPDSGARLARHFDWYALVTGWEQQDYLHSMECFGIDPAILPQGTSIRQNLAIAAEVHAEVEGTVSWANRYGQLLQVMEEHMLSHAPPRANP